MPKSSASPKYSLHYNHLFIAMFTSTGCSNKIANHWYWGTARLNSLLNFNPVRSISLPLISCGEWGWEVIAFDILGQHFSARCPCQLLLLIPDRSVGLPKSIFDDLYTGMSWFHWWSPKYIHSDRHCPYTKIGMYLIYKYLIRIISNIFFFNLIYCCVPPCTFLYMVLICRRKRNMIFQMVLVIKENSCEGGCWWP